MAKTTAPFLSLAASGTFAKTLTASKWKGRSYMRLRVIPSNPKTVGQLTNRSIIGTMAKAAHAVLTSFADVLNVGSQFFIDSRDGAPSGQSWISWLQKVMNSLFAGYVTSYAALSGTIQGYYDAAAATIGLNDYTDVLGTVHTAGEQLYMLANFAVGYLSYTGFASGPDSATSAETIAFGTYVHTSA